MVNYRWLGLLVVGICLTAPSAADNLPHFYGDEVVVTATKQLKTSSEIPWNTTTLSQLELRQFTTVGQALQTVAGVDSQSYGGLGALNSVRLRGANSSQVLVLIDGRRINSPTLGMFDFGDLLTDDLERVEVVRAPLSALYGSDAVTGAINLITKDKSGSTAALEYGSFNTQGLKVSFDAGNLFLNAKYLSSDGFRQNGDYLAKSFYGKYSLPISFLGHWTLDLGLYDSNKGVPGVPTSEADPYSATEPNDRQTDKNMLAGVNLKGEGYQFNVYNATTDQKLDPYIWGASQNKTNRLAAGWEQTLGNLLYGVETREDRGQTMYSGDHTIRNYAVYVQEETSLNDRLGLIFGLRADRHSTAGTAFSPRAGLNYQLAKRTYFKASVGSAFRAPTLNELYWNDGWMFGDPNLKPERSFSYELSLEKELGYDSYTRISYYSAKTTDMILWDWQSSTIETRAKNVGQVDAEGVEFELVKKLGGEGKAFLNYTYQRAVDSQDFDPLAVGKTIRYTPANKFNLGVLYAGTGIYLRHVGEQYADSYNTVKLPAFTVVDLKLASRNLTFAVDNLFDEKYSEAVGNDPMTYAVRNYPMPGRSYKLSLKWDW